MKQTICFWCSSKVEPPYISFTSDNLETVLCRNCRRETPIYMKKDEITEEIKNILIKHDNEWKLIDFIKSKNWFCHNCGKEHYIKLLTSKECNCGCKLSY